MYVHTYIATYLNFEFSNFASSKICAILNFIKSKVHESFFNYAKITKVSFLKTQGKNIQNLPLRNRISAIYTYVFMYIGNMKDYMLIFRCEQNTI